MTTYTKTQLIDMAIDKLGESPDWGDYHTIVSVSGKINTVHGFGKFVLGTEEGQRVCDEIVPNAWQLVCTRGQFEQRVAERKASKPVDNWWDYENDRALSFPPAGTECEYLDKGKWYKTTIVGRDSEDYCVFEVNKYDPDFTECPYNGWNCISKFKPLPKLTERQQAGLKLWRAINYKGTESDEFIISQERFEDYCRPFDQGLLK